MSIYKSTATSNHCLTVVLLLFLALIFNGGELEASGECEIRIRVDMNSSPNTDWMTVYTHYQERLSNISFVNLSISDLQETLLALNTTIFHRANDCVEIIVLSGFYSINQSVFLTQSVRVIGATPGEVHVDFSSILVAENVTFDNVVTVFGSEHVEIRGIYFLESPGIIAVERVAQVTVADCIFQRFFRGALDIYQSFLVRIDNCTFLNNGMEGVVKADYQYRGHAGGLSVGFDDNHYNKGGTDPATVPDQRGIYVSNCVFRNNTSDPGEVFTTTELLQLYVFTGRGGAISITINSSFALNATLTDCLIEDNFAESFGGGLYLGYSGYAAHTTSITRVMFARNRCVGPSGALQLGFIEGADNGFAVMLEVYNSTFYENDAEFGGAIHLFANQTSNLDRVQLSQVAYIENCTFVRNSAREFGAAICLTSLLFLVDTSSFAPVVVVNCTFEENTGGRAGVLSTAYLPLSFQGINIFKNNNGRVLVISGTRAEIHGSMQFLFNDAEGLDSGSLYITSFGQLQLFSGADMVFTNNSGVLGAAIVVDFSASFGAASYSQALFNPLCALRSENSTESPLDWRNINITFSGNRAFVGSAVFMNEIDLCSWVGSGPQFFDRQQVFHWKFINFTNNNVNEAHFPEVSNPLWSVQTQAEMLTLETSNVSAYPGEEFPVKARGVDEYGQPVPVSIRLTDDMGSYEFSPSASSPPDIQSPSIITKVSVANNSGLFSKSISVTSIITELPLVVPFTLTTKPCPVGYTLRLTGRSRSTCQCNDEGNAHITNCDGETLQLADGLWGVESPGNGDNGDRLTTYSCPQHYCQCLRVINNTGLTCRYLFNPEQPDEQCFCKRKGVLCGECTDESAGFSALLNNCKSCGMLNILYVIALMILDTLVIGGLLLILKGSVYSWIYPSIFYLQILPYVTFHFPVTFEVVHPYLYYVSSALSFYFTYDFCLWPQLSALLSYLVRFTPLLVTIATAVPVFFFRRFCQKDKEVWPGLWLVVLLQYTHVVHTCMSVLNCPMLPGHDGVTIPRWYINGNIECFTGGHTPLALLSIAVLIIFVIVIPLIMAQTMLKSKKRGWLQNIVVPSSEAYKKEYSWWGTLELLRRVFIVLFAVAFPTMEYWVIFSLSLVVGVYLFVQPYRTQSANIIEAVLATNLLILLLLRSVNVYSFQNDSPQSFVPLRDPSSDMCIDSAIHTINILTIVLTTGYYIPLAVFVLVLLVSIGCVISSSCKKHTEKLPQQDELTNSTYGHYYLLEEGSNAGVTISDVTTDDQQIPLSAILRNIYEKSPTRKSSRKNTKLVNSLTSGTINSVKSQPSFLLRRRSST